MRETLIALLQDTVNKSPNLFYTFGQTDNGWHGTTFLQMQQKAQALAAFFVQKGLVQAGDKLALLAPGSPEWVLTELGALHAGVIAVPLSMKLLPEELAFRIEHSESGMIACSALALDRVIELIQTTAPDLKILWLEEDETPLLSKVRSGLIKPEQVVCLTAAVQEGLQMMQDASINANMQERFSRVQPDDVASLSYSSGTTGNPKGVLLTHRNYAVNVTFATQFLQVAPGARMLMILPIDHAMGHTIGIYNCIYMQLELYFMDARGGSPAIIKALPGAIQYIKPDLFPVVPALTSSFMKKMLSPVNASPAPVKGLFHWVLKATIQANGSIYQRGSWFTQVANFIPIQLGKHLVFPKIRKAFPVGIMLGGGALIDRQTQEFFHAIGVPLYQGYGMTESSPMIAASGTIKNTTKLGTIGPVCTGLTGAIMHSDGTFAKPGEQGEIVIKGPTVMKGYYKNAEATAQALRGGWLHTGDLGTLDKDGFLSVIGREKALLINKDGEKYSPEAIEEAIMTSPLVDQAMLYCDHNPYTVALVVLNRTALAEWVRSMKTKLHLINDSPDAVNTLLALLSEQVFAFKNDVQYKKSFPKLWLPGTFHLVPDPLELNSTLKMVRHKVVERYQAQLNFMFSAEGSHPTHNHNYSVLASLLNSSS